MKKKFTSVFTVLIIIFCLFFAFFGTPEDGSESLYDSMTVPGTEAVETAGTQPSAELTAIMDAAYALEHGEYLDGTHTLTGTIVKVPTRYSSKYENITVVIQIPGHEDRPIQCFRLEGQGAEELAVGDTVTVTGALTNYKGTIEFDAGCQLDAFVKGENSPEAAASDNDDSKEAVALYIHTNGCLPDFYMTKAEARDTYGWDGGALDLYAPGMCIGGDEFRNYEGQLPDAPGRYYIECDIHTIGSDERGAERIVFSNDGLVFYTSDHYETFELLYGAY